MRRSWWLISLIGGLAVCGALVWRVMSQSHEVRSTQILNRFKAIDEDRVQGKITPSEPESSRYNDPAASLREDLENNAVDAPNRRGFEYLSAWSEFRSAGALLEETLGKDGATADPRPGQYQVAWRKMLQALRRGNSDDDSQPAWIDVPLGLEKRDYDRFLTQSGDRLLGKDMPERDLLHRLGLRLDEERHVVAANAGALRVIGVNVTEGPGTPDRPLDLVLGRELTPDYRDFLANRLTLHDAIEEANLTLAHRFVEIERPEFAWQHYHVIYKEIPLARGMVIESMLQKVLALKRRHIEALVEWSKSRNDESARARLLAMRETYDAARDRYAAELDFAALSARQAASETSSASLKKLRDRIESDREHLLGRRKELEEFAPELFKEQVKSYLDDDELIAKRVQMEELDNKKMLEAIDMDLKRRVLELESAIDDMFAFARHLEPVAANAIDEMFISRRDLMALLETSPTLKPLAVDGPRQTLQGRNVERPANESIVDDFDRYAGALRGILMTDLRVLRARIARLVSGGEEMEQAVFRGLEELHADYMRVRDALPPMISSSRAAPGKVGANGVLDAPHFQFVNGAIAELEKLARASGDPTAPDRLFFAEMANEIRRLRQDLLRGSFELAELRHGRVLRLMGELTGDERPIVTASAADRYRADYARWYERARDVPPSAEVPPPPPADDERLYGGLGKHVQLETEYRRRLAEAIRTYETFEEFEDDATRRRARFGVVSLLVDDLVYHHDWKRRHGIEYLYAQDPSVPRKSDMEAATWKERYGTFAFVAGPPPGLEARPGIDPAAGYWLSREQMERRFIEGPVPAELRQVESLLAELRTLVPSQDPELYAAIWMRSGQVRELRQRPAAESGDSTGEWREFQFPGDLPGAIAEFYLPLLKDRGAVPDAALLRNRYAPLATHFKAVRDKIDRWMESVDESNPESLRALFQALAPAGSGAAGKDEGRVSEFYGEYFAKIAERAPGLLAFHDTVYDFNFRLGELAQVQARHLLESATSDVPGKLREADEMENLAHMSYRAAGKALRDYVTAFPGARGEVDRQIRIGDAYFRSRDYVFAIRAYTEYFENRRVSDRRNERAGLFYAANQIGEAFSELGVYLGESLKNDPLMGSEGHPVHSEAIVMDGAIPAFLWVTDRTRKLLQGLGEGGAPQNRLPPTGALEAFINLARARLELGRIRSGLNDPAGPQLMKLASSELERDLIAGELFSSRPMNFSESLAWRDAQYVIGSAQLELARQSRLGVKDATDHAAFMAHLEHASRAFNDIIERWPEPTDRLLYQRRLNEGMSYADALAAGGGREAEFTDDIFYLVIFQRAEADWLRAVHARAPLSDSVLADLNQAIPRLELLRTKLDRIHGKEKPLMGTTFTFPALDRQVRYRLADVLYLVARTNKDRLFPPGAPADGSLPPAAEITHTRMLYQRAMDAYNDAIKLHPDTYLAAWAYGQLLNCERALGQQLGRENPDMVAAARRRLAKADTFLARLSDDAFAEAPQSFGRADFTAFFKWYRDESGLN